MCACECARDPAPCPREDVSEIGEIGAVEDGGIDPADVVVPDLQAGSVRSRKVWRTISLPATNSRNYKILGEIEVER